MRIAFISHEFPPETGGGGIGTYLAQIVTGLAAAGESVEVFAGGREASKIAQDDGVVVHRIPITASPNFGPAVVETFVEAHRAKPFDVIEGNDFDASALQIKRQFPTLPYVCKLHTPRFAIDEMHHRLPSWSQRLRITLGSIRRGRRPPSFSSRGVRQTAPAQAELEAIACADVIAAPSQAIALAAREWVPGSETRTRVFPYPFVPAAALLKIPAGTRTERVTYLGRLEERKGVLDLAGAIPQVLRRHPSAKFRFIGRSMPAGYDGTPMDQVIRSKLGRAAAAVEFSGARSAAEIPRLLAETDLLVAPSHWESFGLVCCEGLAAARGVVVGSEGGMAEITDHGACGLLVPPRHPGRLAQAICDLLAHPDKRIRLAEQGRERILEHYSLRRVLPQQLDCYRAAIAACRHSVN